MKLSTKNTNNEQFYKIHENALKAREIIAQTIAPRLPAEMWQTIFPHLSLRDISSFLIACGKTVTNAIKPRDMINDMTYEIEFENEWEVKENIFKPFEVDNFLKITFKKNFKDFKSLMDTLGSKGISYNKIIEIDFSEFVIRENDVSMIVDFLEKCSNLNTLSFGSLIRINNLNLSKCSFQSLEKFYLHSITADQPKTTHATLLFPTHLDNLKKLNFVYTMEAEIDLSKCSLKKLEFFSGGAMSCSSKISFPSSLNTLKEFTLWCIGPFAKIDLSKYSFEKLEVFTCGEIGRHAELLFPSNLPSLKKLTISGSCWDYSKISFPSSLNALEKFTLKGIGEYVKIDLSQCSFEKLETFTCGEIGRYAELLFPSNLPSLKKLSTSDIKGCIKFPSPTKIDNLEEVSFFGCIYYKALDLSPCSFQSLKLFAFNFDGTTGFTEVLPSNINTLKELIFKNTKDNTTIKLSECSFQDIKYPNLGDIMCSYRHIKDNKQQNFQKKELTKPTAEHSNGSPKNQLSPNNFSPSVDRISISNHSIRSYELDNLTKAALIFILLSIVYANYIFILS